MTEDKGFTTSETAKREEETLKKWQEAGIFEKTLAKDSPEGEFVFYEGPPTANGRPGIHHLESRSFKDVIPRYKTMQGFYVRRKAGWDTHGLPVELEVEKQLGFKGKKEIEAYGIAPFNEKCKESVWKYVSEWREFTERIGYWVDLDDAYVTYYPEFIESVWNLVGEIEKKKLLYKDYKVVPWCPRCGTALSSHELAQGYQDVKDLSVYAKFRVKGEENTYLLAWTTTPWTLPGNVGLAVGPEISYVYADLEGATYIIAKDRLAVLGEGAEIKKEVVGTELLDLDYEPLYPYLGDLIPDKDSLKTAFKVYPADFVTTTDGTGIVHTAVMYGQEDFELGTAVGLPKFHMVDETGHFIEGMDFLSSRFVRDEETAVEIIKNLAHRGLLFKKEKYEHSYPHCWRCKTPLIYYARDSWYVRMSDLREELIEENKDINWVPLHIKEGRFGEWLKDVKDWAVSRDRYWGTPLPVWVCQECDEREVVGSIEQLLSRSKKSGNRYIVMRHGEALSNEKDVLCSTVGHKNDALTDKGREAVRATVEKLRDQKIDVIITSPFGRTRETADILAEALGVSGVVTNEALREIEGGEFDGKPIPDFDAVFAGDDWYTVAPKGGESHADVAHRAAEFLFDLEEGGAYRDKNILIITHGAVARMLGSVATRPFGTDPESVVGGRFITTAEYHEIPFVAYPHDAEYKLDLHKPYIDDVIFGCTSCGNDMRRTPEVMDVWFDSGAVPFAQDHYPFENQERIDGEGYPADYIAEAVDQTRGWFYTLHAVGVLMGRGKAYKNVICLGHILDSEGKKMSKSVGNVINPWEMIAKYGVDVLRFWMFSVNQPGDSKNFDEQTVAEIENKVFTLLRNITKFYELSKGENNQEVDPFESENPLDQWVLTLLRKLVVTVTDGLDAYDTFTPTRAIREFVGDYSTWYVRRSRDRMKEDGADKDYALATMRLVSLELSKLLAPFTPFFAEEIYEAMGGAQESVHLEEWPTFAKASAGEDNVLSEMESVRKTVSLALEARMNAKQKIRQPLSKLTVRGAGKALASNSSYAELIKDEVNVKEVVFDSEGSGWEVELDTDITPELKKEGDLRELIRSIQAFRKQSNLSAGEEVALTITTDAEGRALVEEFKDEIISATTLSALDVSDGGESGSFAFAVKE